MEVEDGHKIFFFYSSCLLSSSLEKQRGEEEEWKKHKVKKKKNGNERHLVKGIYHRMWCNSSGLKKYCKTTDQEFREVPVDWAYIP